MNPADGNSPLKVFGRMFGFYRDRAGLTYEELAAMVYLSASQVYKVERGLRAPSADLVTRCEAIPAMRCDGALRALYNSMVEYLKVGVFPGWFQGWPDKEAAAVRLRNFELVVLPGLGQTEAYARALISARFGISPDEVDDEVAARLARQAILDREKPPLLWFIIDEATLRRPVGSRQVMREQLAHLAAMARKPNIVVQVIPLEAGGHEGLASSFVIAEFHDAPDAAYQDTAVSGQIIEDEDAVKRLARTWEALQRVTLPEALSLRKIEETITEL